MIESAQFTSNGRILAVRHGIAVTVPDDPKNTVRQEYEKWLAAGNEPEPYDAPPPSAAEIKAEAERRIDAGATIDGIRFRTDDATMVRLRGLLDAFDAGLVPQAGVTYRTDAGAALNFKDKAAVQRLYVAANLYRSKILEVSADLQARKPIPADYTNDSHWA